MRKDGRINRGNDVHAGYIVWERRKTKQLLDLHRTESCGTWVGDDLIKISEYEGMSVCTMDSLE